MDPVDVLRHGLQEIRIGLILVQFLLIVPGPFQEVLPNGAHIGNQNDAPEVGKRHIGFPIPLDPPGHHLQSIEKISVLPDQLSPDVIHHVGQLVMLGRMWVMKVHPMHLVIELFQVVIVNPEAVIGVNCVSTPRAGEIIPRIGRSCLVCALQGVCGFLRKHRRLIEQRAQRPTVGDDEVIARLRSEDLIKVIPQVVLPVQSVVERRNGTVLDLAVAFGQIVHHHLPGRRVVIGRVQLEDPITGIRQDVSHLSRDGVLPASIQTVNQDHRRDFVSTNHQVPPFSVLCSVAATIPIGLSVDGSFSTIQIGRYFSSSLNCSR